MVVANCDWNVFVSIKIIQNQHTKDCKLFHKNVLCNMQCDRINKIQLK